MAMMNEFTVLNIRDKLRQGKSGEDFLMRVLPTFACPVNPDVERFLVRQSIDFTKRNQSVTYLVFSRDDGRLVGYFTLTIKPISVNASAFSRTMRRKIERVSEVNEQTGEYLLAAYLIAQLGKNYKDGMNKRITGAQLLQSAIDAIREAQYRLGGTVVFLEADNVPQLLDFYTRNGFKRFAVRKSRGTQDQHKLVQLLRVM